MSQNIGTNLYIFCKYAIVCSFQKGREIVLFDPNLGLGPKYIVKSFLGPVQGGSWSAGALLKT